MLSRHFFTAVLLAFCGTALGISPKKIFARQYECDAGYQVCGDGCIVAGWQCCADGSGGCDPDYEACFRCSDGTYGCCPLGESCDGGCGTETIGGSNPGYTTSSYYYTSTRPYTSYSTTSYQDTFTDTYVDSSTNDFTVTTPTQVTVTAQNPTTVTPSRVTIGGGGSGSGQTAAAGAPALQQGLNGVLLAVAGAVLAV